MDVDESIVEKPAPRKSKRSRSSKSSKKSKNENSKTKSMSNQMEVEEDGDNEQKEESNPPTAEPSVDLSEMVKCSIAVSSYNNYHSLCHIASINP